MASKYAELAKTLPRAPKAPFSDEVNAAKERFQERTPGALAKAYEALKARKAEAEEAVKAINTDIRAVEDLLFNAFDEAGIQKVTLDSGRTVSVNPEPYVVTLDRDQVRQWAIENGHERDLNFNANTLSAIVKTRALNREGLPPGVELKVWSKVGITKG